MAESLTVVKDPEAWDVFVASSVKPHVFQSWGWGEVKTRTGWRAHRLVLERDGRWRAGLSMLERPLPLKGKCFLYAARGPVLPSEWAPDDLSELLDCAKEFARARGAVFLKIDPDVPEPKDWLSSPLVTSGFSRAPESGGFSGVQPRVVFRLDIGPSEEDLLRKMDQKTRYNIRLAEKRGVAVRPVSERLGVETFYRVLEETAQRDGFLIRPLTYFLNISEILGSRGQAQYFLSERGGACLGGALALRCGPVCWYAYGASANAGREHMPNHLVQWTLIRWAKQQGCRLYDFRAVPSSAEPGDPLYGLYRFKKGFGGDLTAFVGEFDYAASPLLYFLWVKAWPVFRRARKFILSWVRR